MITIKEIASILGVSPTTVSNVVNGHTGKMSRETRQRVEEALIKYSFRKNEMTGEKSNDLKLVSVDFSIRFRDKIFTDPFCAELLDSICVNLRKYGRYTVCGSTCSVDEIYEKMKSPNVEGGIIVGLEPAECQTLFAKAGKPIVFIDSGEGIYDNVGIEDYKGGRLISEYLLKQGHRKIAFLCDRKNPVSSTLDRFEGYCDALKDYGIDFNNKDYYYLPDDKIIRRETLREFAGRIKNEGYTAAFVVSDFLANEVIKVLSAEGLRVPEDISVTGFDDNIYASLIAPPLTTIRQSVYEKGERAVSLLMQRIMGEEVLVSSFKLPVELIVRNSVKNIN